MTVSQLEYLEVLDIERWQPRALTHRHYLITNLGTNWLFLLGVHGELPHKDKTLLDAIAGSTGLVQQDVYAHEMAWFTPLSDMVKEVVCHKPEAIVIFSSRLASIMLAEHSFASSLILEHEFTSPCLPISVLPALPDLHASTLHKREAWETIKALKAALQEKPSLEC